MSGRIFSGLLPKISCCFRPNYGLNLWGQFCARSYSTAQRTELTGHERIKKSLDFEHFKRTQLKSFETFKKSPGIRQVFGDDMEKISQAYDGYCLIKFNDLVQKIYGGDPSRMI